MLDLRDEDAVYEDGDFIISRSIRAYSEGMMHGQDWKFAVKSIYRLWYKREYLECHSELQVMIKLAEQVKQYIADNKIKKIVVCDGSRQGKLKD